MADDNLPHILLGVTGSVAGVKFAQLAVKLSQFAEVCVVTTGTGRHFCDLAAGYDPTGFAEFEALGVSVYTDSDEWEGYRVIKSDPVLHVELHKWADIIIVAPCSANTLGKLANGLADNLLTCVCRVWTADTPVIVAPAMNTNMWHHPVTARHLAAIQEFGFEVIPPISKELACGDVGMGAMADVDSIVSAAHQRISTPRPMVASAPAAAPRAAIAAPPPSYASPAQHPPPASYAAVAPPTLPPARAAPAYPAYSAAPAASANEVPSLVAGMLSRQTGGYAGAGGAGAGTGIIDTSGLAEALARVQALNQSAAQQQAELAQAAANQAAVQAAASVMPSHLSHEASMAQEYAAKQLEEAQAKQKALARAQAEAFMKVAEEQVRLTGADEGAAARRSLDAKLQRYSLRAEAARKRRIRERTGSSLETITPHMAFADSRLVKGDDAVTLFTLMPLVAPDYDGGAPQLPKCKLLFATWNNYPATLQEFTREFPTVPERGPTVVLVKCGDNVFGGYAADAWNFDDLYHGKPTSFLFSITKDCKLPYHGRVKGPKQEGDPDDTPAPDGLGMGFGGGGAASRAGGGASRAGGFARSEAGRDDGGSAYGGSERGDSEWGGDADDDYGSIKPTPVFTPPRHDCLKSDKQSIQFGLKDLILRGDLSSCSSELENSYGIGLQPGSTAAKTLLAGSPVFKVDAVEIWAVGSLSSGYGDDGGDSYGGSQVDGDDYDDDDE